MHHDKKLYGAVTVGTKGQIVIPAEAREEFEITAGDRLYVVGSKKAGWIGLLKEDQLQAHIEHLTASLETLRESARKAADGADGSDGNALTK